MDIYGVQKHEININEDLFSLIYIHPNNLGAFSSSSPFQNHFSFSFFEELMVQHQI